MKYKLEAILSNPDHPSVSLFYNTKENTLRTQEDDLFTPKVVNEYRQSWRTRRELLVNIVMGTACNYRCGYCCQASGMKDLTLTPLNVETLIRNIHAYKKRWFPELEKAHILLWGGEPLLYLSLIKELTSGLKDLCPYTKFVICSNGSLLNEVNFKFLMDHNIGVGFSYDGPGQWVRNPHEDVLSVGSCALELLKTGIKEANWVINPVIHKGNPLLSKFITFMTERLATDEWDIGSVQHLNIVDEASRSWALNPTELYRFTEDVCKSFLSDPTNKARNYYMNHALAFIRNLNKPNAWGGCKNATGVDVLNLDIQGNLWACHTTVGLEHDDLGGNLKIGTLSSLDERKEPEFRVLEKRRKDVCSDCIMRTLCGGGCAVAPMKYETLNCQILWHQWFPALSLATGLLTGGGQLVKVEQVHG